MIRSKCRTIALIVVLLSAGAIPVFAVDLGVGIRGGTHGFGAELGVGVTEWFTVRGGFSTLEASKSFEESGIDYDGDFEVGGVGFLADFFPMRGKFRLTAGLFANENEIGIEATPTTPEVIGGTLYTPAEIGTLRGEVTFDATAPYAGIGWGNVAKGERFGFLFDAGVLAQGSGDVTLTSTGTVSLADLNAEIAELEDDIDSFDLWPVVSFGLSIRF